MLKRRGERAEIDTEKARGFWIGGAFIYQNREILDTEGMIVYLYGPDSFRRNRRVQFYLEQFRKKHAKALSVERFDLEEEGALLAFSQFLSSQSLFGGGYKLGIIRGVADCAPGDFKKVISPAIEAKETTVIISEDKKLSLSFGAILKKAFRSEEFASLSGGELDRFLAATAKDLGVTVSELERSTLLKLFSGDTAGLVNELKKLALGSRLEAGQATPNIFPLMFQIVSPGPISRRLSALAWVLEREDPARVFNILAAGRDEALQIKMAAHDVEIKSGKLEYEEALLRLAIG